MHTVMEEYPVYEERRGWTSQTILSASIMGPIAVALAVWFAVGHQWFGLFLPAFFLFGVLGMLDGGIRKPVALRMDERGIRLTKGLARKAVVFVPWAELHAVWLMPRTRRFDAFGVSTRSAPDAPLRTFAMVNWQADFVRVAELLARYAPAVPINNRANVSQF